MMFLCSLATKWAKITKVGGMFRDFQLKTVPYMFRDFSQKSDLLERHTPVLPYTASTPHPPPPPPPGAATFTYTRNCRTDRLMYSYMYSY